MSFFIFLFINTALHILGEGILTGNSNILAMPVSSLFFFFKLGFLLLVCLVFFFSSGGNLLMTYWIEGTTAVMWW